MYCDDDLESSPLGRNRHGQLQNTNSAGNIVHCTLYCYDINDVRVDVMQVSQPDGE